MSLQNIVQKHNKLSKISLEGLSTCTSLKNYVKYALEILPTVKKFNLMSYRIVFPINERMSFTLK